jgi:hypothetical protein
MIDMDLIQKDLIEVVLIGMEYIDLQMEYMMKQD